MLLFGCSAASFEVFAAVVGEAVLEAAGRDAVVGEPFEGVGGAGEIWTRGRVAVGAVVEAVPADEAGRPGMAEGLGRCSTGVACDSGVGGVRAGCAALGVGSTDPGWVALGVADPGVFDPGTVCAGGRRCIRTTGAGAGSAGSCPWRTDAESPATATARSVQVIPRGERRPVVGDGVKA